MTLLEALSPVLPRSLVALLIKRWRSKLQERKVDTWFTQDSQRQLLCTSKSSNFHYLFAYNRISLRSVNDWSEDLYFCLFEHVKVPRCQEMLLTTADRKYMETI